MLFSISVRFLTVNVIVCSRNVLIFIEHFYTNMFYEQNFVQSIFYERRRRFGNIELILNRELVLNWSYSKIHIVLMVFASWKWNSFIAFD